MDPAALLDGLDDAQRHAVLTTSRPLVIHAAAGSGKTRVLTRRVAYRAAVDELDPRHTLCVTFTREAAAELRGRLRVLGLRDLPAAGTFHSVALSMLRARWHDRRSPQPDVLADRLAYLRRVARGVESSRLRAVSNEIDWARASGVGPARYPDAAERQRRRPGVPLAVVARAFTDYEAAKQRARLIDFDDLLEQCAQALERDEAFATAQRWRFRHLFVDEFQDVNPLQFRLLRAWLGSGTDLCVVGDPNQAIYGWNGADPTLLHRLADLVPGGEVVRLSTNHRSSPQIVALADAALTADDRTAGMVRPPASPPLVPSRPGSPAAGASSLPAGNVAAVSERHGSGPLPAVYACADEGAEVARIAALLTAWRDRGTPWRAQAVLVRTNALARHLHDGLSARRIPVGQLRRRTPSTALPPAGTWSELIEMLAEDGEGHPLAPLAAEYGDIDPRPSPAGFAAWLRTVETDPDRGGADVVSISTFHAAKGREWRAVVVAGLEDGFVPNGSPRPGSAVEAEERRLLYVALSRASESLACTWSARRSFRDGPQERRGSRYLPALQATCDQLVTAAAPAPPPPALRALTDAAGAGGAGAVGAGAVGAGVPAPATAAELELGRDDAVDARARRAASLLAWRAAQARVAAVAPAIVLTDAVVDALADAPPSDLDALARHPGIGPLRAGRFGPALLAALHSD